MLQGTLTGLLNGDPISAAWVSPATITSPVGDYPITPVWSDPADRLSNYNLVTNVGTLTITKAVAALVATALSTNRPYGATNPMLQGTLTGLLNGDPISAAWVSPATTTSPVGDYPITPVWSDPAGRLTNYNLATNMGALSVTAVPLAVTAAPGSRPYGDTNPIFSGTGPVGVLNGDRITAIFVSAASPTTPPGVYGPGSPFAIRPVLNDPDARLSNYLVTTHEGALTILTSASVRILEPTNGSIFFPGMDVPLKAETLNTSAPLGPLVFNYATNQLTGVTTNDTNYTATITNIAIGSYMLRAFLTNGTGQTISSDPIIFSVADIPWALGSVDTNSLEVRQTGLYFQDLWITNIASLPVPGVTVQITELPPGVQVYNAVQITNGASWLRFDYPIAPGQVLRCRVEYYVPDGRTPLASFGVHLSQPPPPLHPAGSLVRIGYIACPFGDGSVLLQFHTVRGGTYYVQYSANLEDWVTIQPAVVGNDSWIEWLDNGPPKTIRPPGFDSNGHRFYRVLQAP